MLSRLLQGVPRSRFRDTPPFHRCSTLLSRRPLCDLRSPAQIRWLTCWFQRRGTMLGSMSSEAGRAPRITHLFNIYSPTHAIPSHFQSLTLITRSHSIFINVQDACRSSPLRLALPIGCLVKEDESPILASARLKVSFYARRRRGLLFATSSGAASRAIVRSCLRRTNWPDSGASCLKSKHPS